MVNTTAAFRNWLKQATNMKLSSDASVLRVTHEGITNYESLRDFDKESLLILPKVCRQTIAAIPDDPANNITAVSSSNTKDIFARRTRSSNSSSNRRPFERWFTTR